MRFVRGLEGILCLALVALVFAGYPTVRSRANHQRHRFRNGSGFAGRRPAGRHGHADQPHARQRADGRHRRRGPFRLPDRPSRHLYAPGHAAGLQDGGADEPGRERERQAVGGVADHGRRRAERGSHRVEPGHPAAIDQRRTFASRCRADTLKNIANNGRALFNFVTLVPGALSQETGNRELGSVGGFTVNGQRPNSNNITIDGVANIDTGDNGGNMATTNIDAVAEFKILTNAYQAE